MDLSGLINVAKVAKGTRVWNSETILHLGAAVVEQVNKVKDINEDDKITLTCKVLKELLNQEEANDLVGVDVKSLKHQEVTLLFNALEKTVEEVVPVTLRLAFSAAKGKLDLGTVKTTLWASLVSCVFPVGTVASGVTVAQMIAEAESHALAFAEKKAAALVQREIAKVEAGNLPGSVGDAVNGFVKDALAVVLETDEALPVPDAPAPSPASASPASASPVPAAASPVPSSAASPAPQGDGVSTVDPSQVNVKAEEKQPEQDKSQ